MKEVEKKLSIEYRKSGDSIKEIARKLKVSKASVSVWVRNVALTSQQKEKLFKKGHDQKSIDRRRATRIANEENKRQVIIDRAKKDIKKVSRDQLRVIGAMLYWAEGSKTRRSIVEFSNGDPIMIRVMMRFFREVCGVPEKKFRGYIHIHPHLNSKVSEKYWSQISQIPLSQFYKTYQQPNKSSQNKKESLPYGTFGIYVCNTELFLRIRGWTEQTYNWLA